jgi:CheY-like chemotaxis protein
MKKRILLIENDEGTRHVYTTFLRYHGYEVLEAPTGLDGLDLARTAAPDLIITNVAMPGVDGLSVTYALKADAATRGTPIIVCSAFDRENGGNAAELAGCDSYLEKPCDPSRVLAEVQRFVGNPVPSGG